MKRIVTASLALAALAFGCGLAQAHPKLLAANPAAGARVATPTQLRLGFSERLVGKFSKIALADGAGRPAPLGPSTLSRDHKQLIAPVMGKLAPGEYKVTWRAVSTDTHRVQGGYAFMVGR